MKFNKIGYFITTSIILLSIYFLSNVLIESKKFDKLKKSISIENRYKIKKYFFPYKLIRDNENRINLLNKEIKKFNDYSKVYLIHELNIKKNLDDLKFNLISSKNIKFWDKEFNMNIYKNNLQLMHGINNIFPGSAYLDLYNDALYVVSSTGIIGKSTILSEDKILFKQIKNNISDFINIKQFQKDNWFSIKDLLVVNNKIYISYSDELYNDCWATSLLEGTLDKEYIYFERVFRSNQCAHISENPDKEFNAHQSGGRIINLDNLNLLFSHGDYRQRQLSQDLSSVFGKILKINLLNKNYKIISMGHRNPQGLLFDENKNIILSTEHGPQGGDEINLIPNNFAKINNYGWPISSYGEHYKGRVEENNLKYKKYPLLKSHSDHGFIEPLKYFTPSIGISEIIKFGLNDYFVTSLKDKSIYVFNLENEIIKNLERIEIGERVRDAIYKNNKAYLFLEDSASIAIINFNSKNYD
jgi:hypothetical protein